MDSTTLVGLALDNHKVYIPLRLGFIGLNFAIIKKLLAAKSFDLLVIGEHVKICQIDDKESLRLLLEVHHQKVQITDIVAILKQDITELITRSTILTAAEIESCKGFDLKLDFWNINSLREEPKRNSISLPSGRTLNFFYYDGDFTPEVAETFERWKKAVSI